MRICIRQYSEADIPSMILIWNEIVEEGNAFPQEDCLTEETGCGFFGEQTYCAVTEDVESRKIYGLYILHPNNVGRCGHISNRNASPLLAPGCIEETAVTNQNL